MRRYGFENYMFYGHNLARGSLLARYIGTPQYTTMHTYAAANHSVYTEITKHRLGFGTKGLK